jgi:hypothetical protein
MIVLGGIFIILVPAVYSTALWWFLMDEIRETKAALLKAIAEFKDE